MILLKDGVNSKVIVTLTENVTLLNPQFVFVFVNDNTNKKAACKGTDVSAFPDRYNQFSLDVIANANPLLNQITLDNYGFHHYYVYEVVNASLFDYANIDTADLSILTGLLEIGKMRYESADTIIASYAKTKPSIKSY